MTRTETTIATLRYNENDLREVITAQTAMLLASTGTECPKLERYIAEYRQVSDDRRAYEQAMSTIASLRGAIERPAPEAGRWAMDCYISRQIAIERMATIEARYDYTTRACA